MIDLGIVLQSSIVLDKLTNLFGLSCFREVVGQAGWRRIRSEKRRKALEKRAEEESP